MYREQKIEKILSSEKVLIKIETEQDYSNLSRNVVPNFEHASEIQNLGIYFPGNQSKSCHFVQPFSNLILTAIIRWSTCIHSVDILKKANFWILSEFQLLGIFQHRKLHFDHSEGYVNLCTFLRLKFLK